MRITIDFVDEDGQPVETAPTVYNEYYFVLKNGEKLSHQTQLDIFQRICEMDIDVLIRPTALAMLRRDEKGRVLSCFGSNPLGKPLLAGLWPERPEKK